MTVGSYGQAVGTRRDVSNVPPQSAYLAKRCPVRVQLDVLQPVEPLPPAEDVQLRIDQGNDFEAEVFADLRHHAGGAWVFLEENPDDLDRWTADTVAALRDEAPVVVAGSLPIDGAGRRAGRPDVLVRTADGYVPVDVKHHLTLNAEEEEEALVSSLAQPFTGAMGPRVGWDLRKHKDDALQLAHYRRMLESSGFGGGSRWAGIIGKEKVVTWYDLDAPMWQTPAKSDGKKRKTRTTMDVYDFEFAFRLDISAVARRMLDDPSEKRLVVPVRCGDCPSCPWHDYCFEELEAGSGDPSLLPGIGYRPWRVLREHGITDREGVAQLDYFTARLASEGVKLSRLWEEASVVYANTPVTELIPKAKKQLSVLEEHGVATAGDVIDRVESEEIELCDSRFVARAIINARAALHQAPVLRLPDVSTDEVPRADIEVDVDMESTNDGVYLWGALVTDRIGSGLVEEGYIPFTTWNPLTTESEGSAFEEFWVWFKELRAAAEESAVTMTAYAWHASAENTHLRRISAETELATEVSEFIASQHWVDMEDVFKRSWTTGGSTGLKEIATTAGHHWQVEEPGGGISMVRHAVTVDPDASQSDRQTARDWLLVYNRGDLEAVRTVRNWLDLEGATWPIVPTDE